jgi:probable HAF family extracellular repeat protein
MSVAITLVVCALGALNLCAPVPAAAQASFQFLGYLPGNVGNIASGVSADGTVAVGFGNSANGTEAFRWTASTGMLGLGDLPGGFFESHAFGVSGDGSVVVGQSIGPTGRREAFRWSASTGMLGLGTLRGGSSSSRANGVSADGSIIVGSSFDGENTQEAFRWTAATGLVAVGDLPGGSTYSEALAVSADGSVVVGTSSSANSVGGWSEAFRWTTSGGMQGLGDLPGGNFASIATAVSADGSVVVGWSQSGHSLEEAFRWTASGGMQSLSDLQAGPFFSSVATGVSQDGAVVVGWGQTINGLDAFIWDAAHGIRILKHVLQGLGLDMTGRRLDRPGASAVSPNAQHIVGTGTDPSGLNTSAAWIAHLPDQAPSCNAGLDQAVNEHDTVPLDGCASSDPTPTGTLTFQWTQLAGSQVTLSDSTICNPTFTAPFVSIGGETLTFQLEVSDGELTCTDTVNINVVNVNHPPVADAGVDQTLAEMSPVTLHGENSFDCDGDSFSFTWVQTGGPIVSLSGANTANPTFTAPTNPGGDPNASLTLTFILTVDDGFPQELACSGFSFANTVDTVDVKVENINHPPTADAGSDQTVNEGATVTLHGQNSSDPDGDPLSFSWTQASGPIVLLSGPDTANPTFSAPSVGPGGVNVEFELTVDDGFGGQASDRVVVHVQNVNDPPHCGNAQPTVAVLWPPDHKLVPVDITGLSDPDNDPVSIAITGVTQDEPTNGLGDGDTCADAVIQGGTVMLRAERAGKGNGRVYRISFTATDGQGGSCAGAVLVCVPRDMRPGTVCVVDSLIYNSILCP